MPQLDISTYPSQLFWLLITFGLIYWIVARKALPAIGDAIEHRRSRIQDDIEEAERLRRDAEAAIETYEAAIKDAREKARAMIAETRERIAKELNEERQRVETELAEKIALAEKQVREAKQKALEGIEEAVTDLAGEIVTKITGETVERKELKGAVERLRG